MPARCRVAALALGLLIVAASPARADMFATFELPAPSGAAQLDLVKFNVATGAQQTLPTGVNTAANEFHPAISPDGRRLVFVREDRMAGTTQIVLTDLASGAAAQLFSGIEAQTEQVGTPNFSGNATVVTGRVFQPDGSGGSAPRATTTSVSGFPGGPFPKTTVVLPGATSGGTLSRTRHVTIVPGSTTRTYSSQRSAVTGGSTTVSGQASFFINNAIHPAISTETGSVVVERATPPTMALLAATLSGNGTVAALPAVVNAPNTEVSRPEFAVGGRYLAFIRKPTSGLARLYVWDTQTQLLLNDQGVGLPTASSNPSLDITGREEGSIALQIVPNFVSTQITGTTVRFTTTGPTSVGILVQRIVGKHKVLGRSAPKLKLVGRVPFGRFAKGADKVKWDLKVDGKRLKPGKYLVTPRAVTAKAEVLDLGTPRVVTVPKKR